MCSEPRAGSTLTPLGHLPNVEPGVKEKHEEGQNKEDSDISQHSQLLKVSSYLKHYCATYITRLCLLQQASNLSLNKVIDFKKFVDKFQL